MALVDQELSEPYSIFTYRYFAFHQGRCVGTVVCKMSEHRNSFRGYIAMLVVIKPYRGKGIATELVTRAIQLMMEEREVFPLGKAPKKSSDSQSLTSFSLAFPHITA
ncbi:hypothetical protein UlMin_014945 [Ulmus minor]